MSFDDLKYNATSTIRELNQKEYPLSWWRATLYHMIRSNGNLSSEEMVCLMPPTGTIAQPCRSPYLYRLVVPPS